MAGHVKSSPRRVLGKVGGELKQLDSPIRAESPAASVQSIDSISSSTSEETAGLICPICNESMVTLLQLNRHLDDVHSEVEKVDNEHIKSWFKKKVEKAKLQTVTSVFQNSFSKLDLFQEESTATSTEGTPRQSTPVSREAKQLITDEVVTRKHWQKPTGYDDRCSDFLCDKILNARNGSVNCRQCGKLFCNMHTKYQLKLSRKALHDPANGIWCRVCETCYKSRNGYNDHSGKSQDLMNSFKQARQYHIDERELEVNRLEKRLVRLIDLLQPYCDDSGIFNYARIQKRRQIERSVAQWEDDKQIELCRICNQKFGYTLRKHHCRICGEVVCADVNTGCSKNVQLGILAEKLEKGVAKVPITSDLSIRLCRTCKNTIFAKHNFRIASKEPKPDVLRYHDSMTRLRKSIELMMPRFQIMLQHINDPDDTPPHETLTEAAAIRRKLLDSFFQYENLTRKLLTLNVTSETEGRLQKQVYSVGAQFLQDNLLPLKAIPKVLKHSRTPSKLSIESSNASSSATPSSPQPTPKSILKPTSTQANGHRVAKLSEKEVAELQQGLIVMQEQHFLVSQMAEQAKSRRKFDELAPLEISLRDLDKEIEIMREKLGQHDIF